MNCFKKYQVSEVTLIISLQINWREIQLIKGWILADRVILCFIQEGHSIKNLIKIV